MNTRLAVRPDIPAMHAVRLAVRENRLTTTQIGEADYPPHIEPPGCGWVALLDDRVCGFAIANGANGQVWALFVHPDFEGRGVGSRLHDVLVAWLQTRKLPRLWLTTEPGTRAEAFYRARGWRESGRDAQGDIVFERGGAIDSL